MIPDLDVFISSSALEGLQTHRGITHSFLGVAVGAVGVAWVARKFWFAGKSFREVYLVSLFGLLLHIAFDLVTSYGTMVFSPFSNLRVYFDVLFIIDPYLDLILLGGLLLGWRIIGSRGYKLGTLALAGYMVLNVAVTGISFVQLDRWADGQGLEVQERAALPIPFSPLHRRGIVLSGGNYYDVPINLFSGVNGQVVERRSALSMRPLDSLWERREGSIYRWFARFPIVTEMENNVGTNYLIQDLRFMIRGDGLGWLGELAMRAAVDHNPQFLDRKMFSLSVTVSAGGDLTEVFYNGAAIERSE
jgi:inner membrane protein